MSVHPKCTCLWVNSWEIIFVTFSSLTGHLSRQDPRGVQLWAMHLIKCVQSGPRCGWSGGAVHIWCLGVLWISWLWISPHFTVWTLNILRQPGEYHTCSLHYQQTTPSIGVISTTWFSVVSLLRGQFSSKSSQNIFHLACPFGRGMGCILWFETMIYTLPQSLQ